MVPTEKQQARLQDYTEQLFGNQAITSFIEFDGEIAQVVMKIESQEKGAAFTVLSLARFSRELRLVGEKHTWETGKSHLHEPFHCIDIESRNNKFLATNSNDVNRETLRWSNNRGLIIANYIAWSLLKTGSGHYLTGCTMSPERPIAAQRALQIAGAGGDFTTPLFKYILQKRRERLTMTDALTLAEGSWIS